MVSYYFLDQNKKNIYIFFSHIEIVWENNGTKSPNAWKKGKKSETVL